MVLNQGSDAMAELNPHTQRPNLPGASAAGAACAKAADLFLVVNQKPKHYQYLIHWMLGLVSKNFRTSPARQKLAENFLARLGRTDVLQRCWSYEPSNQRAASQSSP